MATEFWWIDGERTQRGPVDADEINRLIAAGSVTSATPLFASGMPDWRAAGQVEQFAARFAAAPPPLEPPPFPHAFAKTQPTDSLLGPLKADLPVWGLLGRGLLMVVGLLLIVPAPWTSTAFYRWVFERVELANGERFTFAGRPGDIWPIFIAFGALIWVDQLRFGSFIVLIASWYLNVRIFRWCAASLGTQSGRVELTFHGDYWRYAGWSLLLALSMLTIVGWAWVLKFFCRWLCRSTRGTIAFDFTANGLEILWRSVLFVLLSALVLPLPWTLRWFMSWMISRVEAVAPTSEAA